MDEEYRHHQRNRDPLIDQVSDDRLFQVKMEVTLVNRQQLPRQESEGVDPGSLPQTIIRKVVMECLENGVFDTTPYIDKRPLIDYIPQEVIASYRPVTKKGRQTVRYSPAQKAHETPELLQLAGVLHNQKILD